jgi:hypothetical protein
MFTPAASIATPMFTTVLVACPPFCSPDQDDIIDETMNFFRANVFFKSFEVKGGADRLMIYLTLFIHQVWVPRARHTCLQHFACHAPFSVHCHDDPTCALCAMTDAPPRKIERALFTSM